MPEMMLSARWRRLATTSAVALLALGLLTPGAAVPAQAAPEGVPLPAFQGGTITAWGDNSTQQDQIPVSLAGKTVTALGPGPGHVLAITSDGKITAWGVDSHGRSTVPASLATKTAAAVAAGNHHSLALTTDGVVTAWGRNDSGQTSVPAGLTGRTVTAIAAGYNHSLALTADGAVTSWGLGLDGRTTVPASLAGKTVTAIAGGAAHSLALTSDGKVTAWGQNSSGQSTVPASLAGKTVTAIAAGGGHSVALTSDGTVAAWGSNEFGQSTVPASLTGKTVTAISSGADHVLAITRDGTVTAWGRNGVGQSTVPAGLAGRIATAVAADGSLSLAISTTFAAEGAPTITGSAAARGALTVTTPRYTAAPDTIAYQWYADGAAVPGATGTTYPVPMTDVGKRLTVQVTATKAGHPTVVGTSAPAGPVAGVAPALQLTTGTTTLRRGQSTAISWSSTDATTLTAAGGWTGTRGAAGTAEVAPTTIGTTSYVLRASNAHGTTTAQVDVRVVRPAARLKVSAPSGRLRAGSTVKVTVRGLDAGERYAIRLGKKPIGTGTAKSARPVTKAVKLPKKAKGRAVVRVTGDQPDRTGTVKVRIVRTVRR